MRVIFLVALALVVAVATARVIPAAHLEEVLPATPKIVRHVRIAAPKHNWLDDVERFTTRIQKKEALLDQDTNNQLSQLHSVKVHKTDIMDELRFQGLPSIPTVDTPTAAFPVAPTAAAAAASSSATLPTKQAIDATVAKKVAAEKEAEEKERAELKKDLPKLADLIAHLRKLQGFEETGKLAQMSRAELLKLEKELQSMVPMIAHFRKEVTQKEANKLQMMENQIEKKKEEIKKEEAEQGTAAEAAAAEATAAAGNNPSTATTEATVTSGQQPFDVHSPNLVVAGVMEKVITGTVTPASGNTPAATTACTHPSCAAAAHTVTTTTAAKPANLTKKNTPHGLKKVFLQEGTQEHVAPIPLVF